MLRPEPRVSLHKGAELALRLAAPPGRLHFDRRAAAFRSGCCVECYQKVQAISTVAETEVEKKRPQFIRLRHLLFPSAT